MFTLILTFSICFLNYLRACELSGIDLEGCDFTKWYTTPSWQECGKLCQQHDRCTTWAWRKFWYDASFPDPRCWLKDTSSCKVRRVNKGGIVSGTKDCPRGKSEYQPLYGVDFVGDDLSHSESPYYGFNFKTTSWKECQRACTRKKQCKAWTWAHKQSTYKHFNCWLKSGKGFYRTHTNYISGEPLATDNDEKFCGKTSTQKGSTKHDELRKRRRFRRTWDGKDTSYGYLEWQAFTLLYSALPEVFKNPAGLKQAGSVLGSQLMQGVVPRLSYLHLFGRMFRMNDLSQFMPGPLVTQITSRALSEDQKSKIIRAMYMLYEVARERRCTSARYDDSNPGHEFAYTVIEQAAVSVLGYLNYIINDWMIQ